MVWRDATGPDNGGVIRLTLRAAPMVYGENAIVEESGMQWIGKAKDGHVLARDYLLHAQDHRISLLCYGKWSRTTSA